ncbi:MAG: hypothetical protein AB8G05_21920 [Oligoflexales bacterium]
MFKTAQFFIFFVVISEASYSYGFSIQDDHTPGTGAIKFKKQSHFWMRFDAGGVDTRTKTSPPDSIYLDRRLESFLMVGGESTLSSGKMGLRFNFKNSVLKQKGEEEKPPKSPKSHEKIESKPAFDFTYVNHKGLELFAGVMMRLINSEKSKIKSTVASSTITYEDVSLFAPRIGLVRRGGQWSGGFYYVQGKEASRSFSNKSSDGTSLSDISYVNIPSEYGIVAEFGLGNSTFMFDFANVQESEGGERTSTGHTVRDDYLRIFISSFLPIGSNLGLNFGLGHKTLSYSSNAYAGVDTIPLTTLKLLGVYGSNEQQVYAGLLFGYGKDGADITEYKARFSFQAIALSFGLFYPI